MSADEIAKFLHDFPHMGVTECVACREPTLYAKHEPSGGPTRSAPKTCGRLACMCATQEAKPIGG